MRNHVVRLEVRWQSSMVSMVRDSVGQESWCQSHMRRLEVGKVAMMLERDRVWKSR